MTIGKLSEFDVKTGNWSLYVERLEMFCRANKISEELWLPTLIAGIGDEAYELLINLTCPDKPSDMPYSDVVKIMAEHLKPRPSFMAERYRFRQRTQQVGETILQYLSELQSLSKYCEFKAALEENLRDQLVCGLRDDRIRQRLFAERNLEYADAIKISCAMEGNDSDSVTVKNEEVLETEECSKVLQDVTLQDSTADNSKAEDLQSEVSDEAAKQLTPEQSSISNEKEQVLAEELQNLSLNSDQLGTEKQNGMSPELLQTTTTDNFKNNISICETKELQSELSDGVMKLSLDETSLSNEKDGALVDDLQKLNLNSDNLELGDNETETNTYNEQLPKRSALSASDGREKREDCDDVTLAKIVLGLQSTDVKQMTSAAREARFFYSNDNFNDMVNFGIIKLLVNALKRDDCSELQYQAAWTITNITAGPHEHTMAVVDAGAIPLLISLLGREDKLENQSLFSFLRNPRGQLSDQATWALGNIAGDGAQTRDMLLDHGILPKLLPLMTPTTDISQLKRALWTYVNLCTFKDPLVKFELVSPGLPYISELLLVTYLQVLQDACAVVAHLTINSTSDTIEEIQKTPNLLPRLVALMGHESTKVKIQACKAVGNMLAGSDEQTGRCLDAGCLTYILPILHCSDLVLVKDACWAVSNILAGTRTQIQTALDAGLLGHLLRVLEHSDVKCQTEAAWVITNLCLCGTREQLDALITSECLKPYCALLSSDDDKIISIVLEGLCNLLKIGTKYNQQNIYCSKLKEVGVLDLLNTLKQHENEEIKKATVDILDQYFKEDVSTPPSSSVSTEPVSMSTSTAVPYIPISASMYRRISLGPVLDAYEKARKKRWRGRKKPIWMI